MRAEPEKIDELHMPDRWTLIRDVAVFQVKLIVDGFRDLVLVPISLVTGLVSLMGGGVRPGSEFYDLLRVGRRSERWINLFGAACRVHGPPTDEESFPVEDIDRMVSRVEAYVVDEYQRGGVTAQAKERLDKAFDLIHRKARRRQNTGDIS